MNVCGNVLQLASVDVVRGARSDGGIVIHNEHLEHRAIDERRERELFGVRQPPPAHRAPHVPRLAEVEPRTPERLHDGSDRCAGHAVQARSRFSHGLQKSQRSLRFLLKSGAPIQWRLSLCCGKCPMLSLLRSTRPPLTAPEPGGDRPPPSRA